MVQFFIICNKTGIIPTNNNSPKRNSPFDYGIIFIKIHRTWAAVDFDQYYNHIQETKMCMNLKT